MRACAEIRFDELMLPSGPLPIVGSIASNGAPVLYLSAPGTSPKRSFVAREWAQAKSNMHGRIAVFTAPGKKDRANAKCSNSRSWSRPAPS